MRIFKEYLKRHIGVMFSMVVLFLFQTCFLFVKQVAFNDLVYFLVLELLVLSVIIAVDVIRYKNRVNKLEEILQRPVSEQSNFVEAGDILEEKYVDMINAQEKSRINTENVSSKNAKEMEQYYNIWVHQIKTPISGMNVVLQSMEPTENVTELQNQLFSVEQYVDIALQY